jgi:DNA polymerase III subunit epsilon
MSLAVASQPLAVSTTPSTISSAPLNFVAIDFETAAYRRDSACSVGLVKVVDGAIVDRAVHLIRPPERQFVFTYIHGLTWKDVEAADDFGCLWPKLGSFLDGADFFAAHNASFDKGVLRACCAAYGLDAPSMPFRCTVQIARRVWNIRPTKLSDVCAKLNIALNHHEALSDATACAKIVLAAASAQAPAALS